MTTRISIIIISDDDNEPGATALGNVVGGSLIQAGGDDEADEW